MNDLEMTRLAAEAMGLKFSVKENGEGNDDVCFDGVDLYDEGSNMWNRCYSPLTNDAQAMALVKRFRLHLVDMLVPNNEPYKWCVEKHSQCRATGADLNHAIVECVAKMQAAK